MKQLNLNSKELLKRILEHVSPIGLHTVRHYGLYAASNKNRKLNAVTEKGTLKNSTVGTGEKLRDMILCCKTCGGVVHLTHRVWKKTSKAFSINRASTVPTFAQPDDDVAPQTG